jgi:hypothetical protein
MWGTFASIVRICPGRYDHAARLPLCARRGARGAAHSQVLRPRRRSAAGRSSHGGRSPRPRLASG